MKYMGELKFQEEVVRYLIKNKIWHFRYTASTTFGLPDIIAIVDGIFVGMELKRPDGKGKPSGLQKLTIESIEDSGGVGAYNLESIEQIEELIQRAKVKRLSNTSSGEV